MMFNEADLETLKEATGSKNDRATFAYWQKEIEESKNFQKNWEKLAQETVDIYKDQASGSKYSDRRYNILYSNVQTLRPLVFSFLPNPEIRRRNLEKDKIARIVSELLERTIKCILEKEDADLKIGKSRDDDLLVRRGALRVGFKANTVKISNDEEVLTDKKITIDYVSWKDVLFCPAHKWEDVSWVAFKHRLTRDQLIEKFGKTIGNKVELNYSTLSDEKGLDQDIKSVFRRALVWEIWDKRSKTVTYISDGFKNGLLSIEDDKYQLQNFFNIPRPLGIDSGVDTIIPVIDYQMYKAQAEELNLISDRITALAKQIKVGGVYSDLLKTEEAKSILNNDGTYDPVKVPPNVNVNNLIYSKDIAPLTNALATLYVQRDQIIRNIQEITGLSDIVRGQTKAQETATAQQLKGNFAISRIQPRQKEVELFCRDIIRIMAELIAQNFSALELAQMSGIQFFDMEQIQTHLKRQSIIEKIPAEQVGEWFKQQLKPVTDAIKNSYAFTSNQLPQIEKVLKEDRLRDYAIEVETDSTIQIDDRLDKQEITEFMSAFGSFSNSMIPIVQAGYLSKDAFKGILSFAMRRFEGSEEIEDLVIDDGEDEPKPPSVNEQIAMKQMELDERKVAKDEFSAQAKAQYDKGKLALEGQKLNLDLELHDSQTEMDNANYQADRDVAMMTELVNARIKAASLESFAGDQE